jgi:hypothetical protein
MPFLGYHTVRAVPQALLPRIVFEVGAIEFRKLKNLKLKSRDAGMPSEASRQMHAPRHGNGAAVRWIERGATDYRARCRTHPATFCGPCKRIP